MTLPNRPHRRSRFLAVATVGLLIAAGSAATTGPAAAAPFVGANPNWPENPDWQKYVQAPDAEVQPVAVVAVTGDVTNADALLDSDSDEVTTLTATPRTIHSSPVTVALAAVQARYLRLDVTKLGLAADGDPAGRYVQLSELQVFGTDGDTNLAAGKTVTTSESIQDAGWGRQFLTDGVTNSENPAAHGWTSSPHANPDLAGGSVWATIDLGSVQTVSRVVLWPRTDTLSPDDRTASFPVDYSVRTSSTDTQTSSFTVQKTVTGQQIPAVPEITGSASILLDYGYNVGGYPTFDVTAASGSPVLQAGYSETRGQVSPTGDGVSPWASGDGKRFNTYTVDGPGRITNGEIQGGERYQLITLTSPGTVSLSGVGISYTSLRMDADDYPGYFVSSSDELNKYWYDGTYTNLINHVPAGTVGARWNTEQGALDVPGTNAGTAIGLLRTGADWTDYTATFRTKIVANQTGWVVRGSNASSGYLLILGSADNTAGAKNSLQQLSVKDGNYTSISTQTLSTPIEEASWHDIREVVSGTTVTTFIDDVQVASFDSASFPSGTPALNKGTVGFRVFSGEEAVFADLKVTGPGGTLYDNALSEASAISDFSVPGNNELPLLLDGAKRDRAVWSGDLAVQGPTLYYSTGTTEYLRGSLELLGSYAGENGYVSGMMPPTTPVGTVQQATPKSPCSANYSMYFVRALGDYYAYTGDSAFVTKEWPIVAKQLAWNASLVGTNGLVVTNNDNGADWDYYDGPKTGEVTAYNALYYKVLLDGAELAVVAGHPELAEQYTTRAAALKTAINERLFNEDTGVYNLSSTVTDVTAQDANVLAILFGIAPDDKVAGILSKIDADLGTEHGTLPFSSGYQKTISPYVSGYELDARFESGDAAGALDLLSREWGPMIEPGDLYTGTFWENLSVTGTQATDQTNMAHGWSTGPVSALSKYVLGIRPVAAGYKTWLVQPHPGDLEWTKGKAPTPHGALSVNWSRDPGTGFAMQVGAPAGTSGTIAVPTFGESIDIRVNGTLAWSQGALVPGVDGVTAAKLDGDYVDLSVGAGTWNISTGPAAAPEITAGVVTVTGKAKVGSTLTAHTSGWKPTTATLAYRWLNNGKAISSATKPTYKLAKSDAGDKISVRVTASAAGAQPVSVTSSSITAKLAFTSKPTPKISGTAKVGKTLKVTAGTWKPSGVHLSYRWYRNGVAVSNATKTSYKLHSADKGKTITVKVTGSKTGYLTETVTSRSTGKVK